MDAGEYHLDLVVGYGAVPVIVPRVAGVHAMLDSFEPIHGVLLCEGEDIDPSLYDARRDGDGEGEQPDGDGKVEQGRRAATATRRSRGRRGRSGRFGRKLLSAAYIAKPLVPVGGTNRD